MEWRRDGRHRRSEAVSNRMLPQPFLTPVRIMGRSLVDCCEPQPDDVSLQNEIAFCNRRTNLRLYPNLVFPVG